MQTVWPKVVKNDDGIRPAGNPDQCFYCKSKIGEEHRTDCCIVTKKVLINYCIVVEIDVPHYKSAEQIEFHRNSGTWCANNLIDELQQIKEEKGCLCLATTAKFIKVTDDTPSRKINSK